MLQEQLLSACMYGVLQNISVQCHICCGGTDRSMLWPFEVHPLLSCMPLLENRQHFVAG